MLFGTAAQDEFRCNLWTGAQRTDTDISTRQLFGYHHHRRFGQAKTAVFLGQGQAKDAHFGQFLDDFHRDQFVFQVPVMGVGNDLFDRVAAELLADHLEFFVKTRCANGDIGCLLLHQNNKARAGGLGIAVFAKGHDLRGHQATQVFLGQADVLGADNFALAHWDTTVDLPEVFTKGDLVDQLLDLAEFAITRQTIRPVLHLAQRLRIGHEPRKRVGSCLVFFDQSTGNAAICRYGLPQFFSRFANQIINGRQRFGRQLQKVWEDHRLGHCNILSVMRHESHLSYAAV